MLTLWWYYFVGLVGIIFVLLYTYSLRKHNYWKNRNVKEIKPTPFFGNILPVLRIKTTIGEWLWKCHNKVDADFFGIFVFHKPILVVKSAKLVKGILQKDFNYFQDRTVANNVDDPVLSNMIFFQRNPGWKPTRSKVSPIFTSGKLRQMFPLISEEADEMINHLNKYAYVPNVETKEVCAKFSTNVIVRCAFAVNAESFKSNNAEFRKLSREMLGFRLSTAYRQIGSWFMPEIIRFFKIEFFEKKIRNRLERILRDLLKLRKSSPSTTQNNLIDMLLEINRKKGENIFVDDLIVGHATQFFVAGFETVSSTLCFAIYELALHPELQERLRAEVLEQFDRDHDITYAVVQEMKYLDMVVCETLRKYPPLPFLDRMCKADYIPEGTDFVLEKGTRVYISIFGLHYDPKYFPDPSTFDPERFSDKSWVNKDGMFYVPFGEGPRICIGQRFGLIGIKLALSKILLKYRLEKSDKTPPTIQYDPMNLVLQSATGVPITYIPL